MINNNQKKKYDSLVKKTNFNSSLKEKLIFFHPFLENEFLQIKDIDENWLSKNKDFIKKVNAIKALNEEDLDAKTKKILVNFNKKIVSYSQKSKMVWNGKETFTTNLDLFQIDSKSQQTIDSIIENNSKDGGTLKLKNSKLDEIFGSRIKNEIDYVNSGLEGNILTESSLKNKINANKKIIYENANYDIFNKIISKNIEIIKETGEERLFLTSYFLEGSIIINQNVIAIRAPIFLFPVSLKKNERTHEIKISFDKTRDVVVNNFIVQNILKTNSYNYDYKKTIEKNIELMFKDLKYNLSTNLSKFDTISVTLARSELGFKIKKYSILGLFKRFDNSVQKEIEEIIESKKVNHIIKSTFSEYDIYTKKQINKIDEKIENEINDDENIFYIDKLNYQQVKALKKINSNDINHLTIWGPPGTGKSQTILSIIIDAIVKNKKVAVIAEKKVALDVIYERLNELKNFSLLITDLNKKTDFFNQLNNSFEFIEKNENKVKDFKKIDYSQKLKLNLEVLDQINLTKKIDKFDNKTIIEVINEIFKYKLESKKMNKYGEFKSKLGNIENLTYKEALEIFKFVDENFTLNGLKSYLRMNDKFITFNNFDEIIKDIETKIGLVRDEIFSNENNLKTLDNVNLMIFDYNKMKSLSWLKRNKKMKSIIETSYLNSKEEVKNFDHEKELKRLLEIEEKLEKELEKGKKQLQKIIENEENIKSYKKFTKDQIIWLEKIVSFSKETIFEEDINLINIVLLNFIIEKIILNSQEFKSIESKIGSWNKQLININFLQEELIKMNKNIVLKNILEKFMLNMTSNNRFDSIQKITSSKKHNSIMEFLKTTGLEIKQAYNIWLMRPEILSTLFENEEKFDIILVDEASQLFIEQSLPALQHSNKIVVLGDEKQLSPSNFFNSRGDEEDEDDIQFIDKEDSLLDFAKTKYPSVMLKNHYRSNYAELIAFSNSLFYNNNLITTNNNDSMEAKPIETIKVEKGIFNNSININEAKEILTLLKEISKNPKEKDKSLGIILMNNPQKEYVENIINKQIKNDSTLNAFLNKSNIFIKSIENVQGDERDIIIFASTYGYSTDGKISIKFGPINNQGGENRINVAVTRSKYKMYVITSLDVADLKSKIKNSKNEGPKVFADFLEYSQNPQLWIENHHNKNTNNLDSKNEEGIIEDIFVKLNKKIEKTFKFSLIRNTDKSNFGIDYIVYDNQNNKNILGIELDINSYKESNFARERDLNKIQYLNLRGWEIHRLWTLNWLKNKDKEINEVINKINKIINK